MEVVCLILDPMLASRPCSHAFWVLMSLYILSFLLKMFFYYSCFTSNYQLFYQLVPFHQSEEVSLVKTKNR